jgi:pimeloyl-ACP methyl ester carboxylesterase
MPETHYARSRDLNIAFQTIGTGPDLVYVHGWVSNVEVMWEEPGLAGFLRRLASFSRLIVFDKRGIGLSDPVPAGELPDLDARVEDLKAVMDAAGSTRATLFGHSEGGSTAVAFAVRHPERVERLILFGAYAKRIRSDDYPWAPTWEQRVAESESFERTWADPARIAEYYAPSRANDQAFISWIGRWLRLSASPKAAAALNTASSYIDVTDLLPEVQVPTLLLYRREDQDVVIEEGRYIASKIPGAKLVELHGADHVFYAGDTEPILEEIEEFVTGFRAAAVPNRVLATVLFTDIVASTDTAAEVGDRRWRELVESHNRIVRADLEKWRGREVNTTGDGFVATFDSPARAISCAQAIAADVAALGIAVRCGVHTGEVEALGDDIAGLAVNIAARVADLAGVGEVLVSRTVRDLVTGSGIEFTSRGRQVLKGVPETWELFAVD